MMRWLLIAVTAVVFSLAAAGCGGLTEDSGTWADPVDEGAAQGWHGGTTQVTICHIPPGNPANAHTITVGSPAVPAHLRHGDHLGACQAGGGYDAGGGDTGGDDGGDNGGGCGGGGGGGGDDGGGGADGGQPGDCSLMGTACTISATCCAGLTCVDGYGDPCSDSACTCEVVVN